MELAAAASATPIALWLNSFFSGYDYAILDFMNTLAVNAGGILTPVTKAITFLGEKGIIFFILAFILLLFPKTRKTGLCVFGAVCCGALITNIVLKDMVARVRPFLDEANEHYMDYKSFWDAVGSPAESGYSFPSGHVTAAAAGMFALLFTRGKKMILPTVLVVGLMMFSRNYLMAHYPSDCLFALIIGIISALIAWGISTLIFNWLDDNGDYPFCNWVLTAKLPFSFGAIKDKASGSFDNIRDKASGSFDNIRDKASGSFDNIMDKASNISMPDINIKGAGKKIMGDKFPAAETPKKKTAKNDWNSRWDEYQRSKHPQAVATETSAEAAETDVEEDVKVFTGSKNAVPVIQEEKVTPAPATEEEILKAPTKNAKKGLPDFDLDSWDNLDDFINADIETEVREKPAADRNSRAQSGAYKGRHVK